MTATIANTTFVPHGPVSEWLRAKLQQTRCGAKRWARALACDPRTLEQRLQRGSRFSADDLLALIAANEIELSDLTELIEHQKKWQASSPRYGRIGETGGSDSPS